MAGSRIGMAESPVRLLIADARTVTRRAATGRHQHAFWQLDHCAGGTFDAVTADGMVVLRPGHGLLLPPGSAHEFRYRPGSRYVSWKFTWDGPLPAEPIVLVRQAGWAGVAEALTALASPAAMPVTGAVPHLLAAAMHLAGVPLPFAHTGFAAAVGALLEAHPARAWSVAAVAAALDLSPGHASARFRAERGMALKRWLDLRRAEHAARLLAASTRSVGEIAGECGFSDGFTFSRFFSRVAGESPSAFRAHRG